ncbi:MAG: DNA primase [Eubacteriaceae bacterium]|nr:DNA primase [Eubacteriaceae bacterium]
MTTTLYKGYVKTKNKKSVEKFKDIPPSQLRTLSQAQECDSYGGVLAEDTLLIDIDDQTQSEILFRIVQDGRIPCKVIKTTRGKHFIFKNNGDFTRCGTDIRLAIGLFADIKIGSKNSYEILKIDGSLRPVEYDTGEYGEAPKFLSPVKSDKDLLTMGDGDGRNSALYGYKMTLHKRGFDADQITQTVAIINRYIFKVPLPDIEMETILRQEDFSEIPPAFYDENGRFLHAVFGDHMIKKYSMVRMDDKPYIFNGKVYRSTEHDIYQKMIQELKVVKAAQRVETYKYIDCLLDNVEAPPRDRFIAFKNGVVDLTTGNLLPHGPEFLLTNLIPFNYDPTAHSDLLDKTLMKLACGDPEMVRVMVEMVGYCMFGENTFQKSFFLTGSEGSNGKSTFLNLLKYMLGKENYSALDVSQLAERFSTVMLDGKLANIGDDVDESYLSGPQLRTFKLAVTGETIKAEQKGQAAYDMESRAKLIFSANKLPRFESGGLKAIIRRLVIIRFDAHFTPADPDYDPNLIYKLRTPEVAEALIAYGVDALREVIKSKRFTEPAKVRNAVKAFEKECNPVILFVEDLDIDGEIIGKSTKDVYLRYSVWCEENGHKPLSNTSFTREIKSILRCETKPASVKGMDGSWKTARIFVSID